MSRSDSSVQNRIDIHINARPYIQRDEIPILLFSVLVVAVFNSGLFLTWYYHDAIFKTINRKVVETPTLEVEHTNNLSNYENAHWPHQVRSIIQYVANFHPDEDNVDKAVHIKRELSKINTTDIFTTLVYNDCEGVDQHYMNSSAEWDIYIQQFRRGKCNIVVHRSVLRHRKTNQDMMEWRSKIEKAADEISFKEDRPYKHPDGNLSKMVNHMISAMPEACFIFAANSYNNIWVESTQVDKKYEDRWPSCHFEIDYRYSRWRKTVFLLAGYP